MSFRATQQPAVAGAIVGSRYHGLGVPGAQVPAIGTDGAGLLREAVVANGWEAKELQLVITTPPASGSLVVFEGTDAQFTGAAAGVYFAIGTVYADGVDEGPLTFIFYNGVTSLVLEVGPVKTGSLTNKAGIGGSDFKLCLAADGQLVARKVLQAGDRLIGLQSGFKTAAVAVF